MPTTTSLFAFAAPGLRAAASFNIARFQTTLIENKSSPKTTLRENETTLFENRPNTSAVDHINANSESGIPAALMIRLPPNKVRTESMSSQNSWPYLEQHWGFLQA
jgi:hypothetical protein